jgi:lysozyme
MNPPMIYSKSGIDLTKQFESCRLVAYQDVKGIWTVGWGHVGPEVCAGYTVTQVQADMQLVVDMHNATGAVNHFVNVVLTQGEFDALVDFAFNCGCSAFAGSTMLRLLNAGDTANAALEFAKWSHASGQVVAGLLRRRLAETQEFNS